MCIRDRAYSAVAQGLGQVGLAGAAGAHDEHRGLLMQIAPGGQVMDQGAVEAGQALKVKLIERLGGPKLRPAQARAEFLLFAPGHLVADEQGQDCLLYTSRCV